MFRYRLSSKAEADIAEILAWTHEQFGEAARQRYERLIVAALRDIATAPNRRGSIERPELGTDVHSWHLRLSRDRMDSGMGVVRKPRHFLIYRVEPDLLIVGRLLHDAMELARHSATKAIWK